MSPRRTLKRYLPDPHRIAQQRHLRWLGPRLFDPRLWHLSRHTTAQGMALGLFCAWLPLPGHMLVAAPLALLLRVNVPIALAAVWITNPLTITPFFIAAYRLGAWLLRQPPTATPFELTAAYVLEFWQPLVTGCAVLGTSCALIGYFGVLGWWRMHVRRRWHARQRARRRV
jgi:hypothetical protein